MIVISIIGLDQFVVGDYSRAHTSNLAEIFEVMEDDVNFEAPQTMIFHQGAEQTSWQTVVIVRAPRSAEILESKAAEYLLRTLKEVSINVEIIFEYYEESHHYEFVNEEYPRYMEGTGVAEIHEGFADDEDYEDDEEADPRDRADLDYNDEHQIYLGDAFAGHEEELEHSCGCDDDDCDCGHHHHH